MDAGSLIVSFSPKSTGHTKIQRHSRLTKSGSSNELICLFSHELGTTWTSSPVHVACCGVCRGVSCAARPPDAAGDHDAPSHGYPLAHPLLHHIVFGAPPRRVLSLTPSPAISVAHHRRHPVLCVIAQDDLGLVLPPFGHFSCRSAHLQFGRSLSCSHSTLPATGCCTTPKTSAHRQHNFETTVL